MAEETGTYEVFPRSVHSFSGLCIFGVIHAVDVIHGPAHRLRAVFSDRTGYKSLYTSSGRADEHQYRCEVRVFEQ